MAEVTGRAIELTLAYSFTKIINNGLEHHDL
jgi:hypothetical protein